MASTTKNDRVVEGPCSQHQQFQNEMNYLEGTVKVIVIMVFLQLFLILWRESESER